MGEPVSSSIASAVLSHGVLEPFLDPEESYQVFNGTLRTLSSSAPGDDVTKYIEYKTVLEHFSSGMWGDKTFTIHFSLRKVRVAELVHGIMPMDFIREWTGTMEGDSHRTYNASTLYITRSGKLLAVRQCMETAVLEHHWLSYDETLRLFAERPGNLLDMLEGLRTMVERAEQRMRERLASLRVATELIIVASAKASMTSPL